MKTVLLTGFEPFGNDSINASEQIVRRLDGAEIFDARVRGIVLPCVFGTAERVLFATMKETRPSVVVCLGQASGRRAITPELRAMNRNAARIADNAGNQPLDTPVVRGGPTAYRTVLPVRAIVAAIRSGGVPAELSRSAGSFVCNHLFYALMHRMARRRRPPASGFIHVPAIGVPEAEMPGLPLESMVRAIRAAIQACFAPGGS